MKTWLVEAAIDALVNITPDDDIYENTPKGFFECFDGSNEQIIKVVKNHFDFFEEIMEGYLDSPGFEDEFGKNLNSIDIEIATQSECLTIVQQIIKE